MLEERNDTPACYPESCIHELFEIRAERAREHTAVVFEGAEVSYGELNRRANQLARHLQRLGVRAEVCVGICVERSIEMVVGILGILKAGGAYVPLDPTYPAQRLSFMLNDAAVAIVLTQRSLLDNVPEHRATAVLLDDDWHEVAVQPGHNLENTAHPGNLAYVIYTSGSTGTPKGVLIEHRSANSFVKWAEHAFSSAELAQVIASTSITFDLSVFELFATLSVGGTVLLVRDPLEIADLKAHTRPSLVNTVPSAARELASLGRIPESVVTINLAGEALREGLVRTLYSLSHVEKVNNLYGPSETTTYATFATVGQADTVPSIGRPVADTQAYVVDSLLEPVPIGVSGELLIGGIQLARGYLDRPAITAERFIPDHLGAAAGRRLYRTGDLVRWRDDGNLEFLGRMDHQVKIRGFRIELGEVENVLLQERSVREAVVVVREDTPEDKRIVAYVAGASGMDVRGVRDHLEATLPAYMVPSLIVRLDALPRTPNGKVDRNALPAPARAEECDTYLAPRTETEHTLCAIWSKILGVETISVRDDFFVLGGHSLLAMQVTYQVHRSFGVEVPMRTLFNAPSVEEFAAAIDELLLVSE